jgi:signal transduction histidine kinase
VDYRYEINDTYALSEEIQVTLYRILQEQLQNIEKYANALKIMIQFTTEREKIKLLIKDDGKGFDVSERKSGIGLENIKRRAEAFGGQFVYDSAPGMGCEIMVSIPIAS